MIKPDFHFSFSEQWRPCAYMVVRTACPVSCLVFACVGSSIQGFLTVCVMHQLHHNEYLINSWRADKHTVEILKLVPGMHYTTHITPTARDEIRIPVRYHEMCSRIQIQNILPLLRWTPLPMPLAPFTRPPLPAVTSPAEIWSTDLCAIFLEGRWARSRHRRGDSRSSASRRTECSHLASRSARSAGEATIVDTSVLRMRKFKSIIASASYLLNTIAVVAMGKFC